MIKIYVSFAAKIIHNGPPKHPKPAPCLSTTIYLSVYHISFVGIMRPRTLTFDVLTLVYMVIRFWCQPSLTPVHDFYRASAH